MISGTPTLFVDVKNNNKQLCYFLNSETMLRMALFIKECFEINNEGHQLVLQVGGRSDDPEIWFSDLVNSNQNYIWFRGPKEVDLREPDRWIMVVSNNIFKLLENQPIDVMKCIQNGSKRQKPVFIDVLG